MTLPRRGPAKTPAYPTDWESFWNGIGLAACILAAIFIGLGGVWIVIDLAFGTTAPRWTAWPTTLLLTAPLSYAGGRLSKHMQWVLPLIVGLPMLVLLAPLVLVLGSPHLISVQHLAAWTGVSSLLAAMLGARHGRRRRRPPHLCRACGYNLIGLRRRDPCPECGMVPFPVRAGTK